MSRTRTTPLTPLRTATAKKSAFKPMSTLYPPPARTDLAGDREGERARPAHAHERTRDPLIGHLRLALPHCCRLCRCCHTAAVAYSKGRPNPRWNPRAAPVPPPPPALRRGGGGRRPTRRAAPTPRTPKAAPAPPLATLRYGAARTAGGLPEGPPPPPTRDPAPPA